MTLNILTKGCGDRRGPYPNGIKRPPVEAPSGSEPRQSSGSWKPRQRANAK